MLLKLVLALLIWLKLVLAPRFVVDDLGWNNVEWHNPEMKTPHSLALVRSLLPHAVQPSTA